METLFHYNIQALFLVYYLNLSKKFQLGKGIFSKVRTIKEIKTLRNFVNTNIFTLTFIYIYSIRIVY